MQLNIQEIVVMVIENDMTFLLFRYTVNLHSLSPGIVKKK